MSVIIGDLGPQVGHSPVLQILLQISVKTSIIVSYGLPASLNKSAGILSTMADFPFFQ